MRAPISVIIPTLNAAAELPAALANLSEGLEAGLIRELIISDGGSADETLAMADAAGAVIIRGAASRGGQLRRGAQVAEGDWLLVLHADTQLSRGWSAAVLDHIGRSTKPAYFRLAFRASGLAPRLVAGWANLRARLLRLPYGDQGLLMARADYEAAGGYPDQPLMEDVALVRRLGPLHRLAAVASTGAERYLSEGWIKRGGRNLVTLLRYLLGADPEHLAQAYAPPIDDPVRRD